MRGAGQRPHYRRHERFQILWHAARYRLSITDAAAAFCVTRQTITNWRHTLRRKEPSVLPRVGTLGDLVHELVLRLKAEWPPWGTRRSDDSLRLQPVLDVEIPVSEVFTAQ